MLPDVAGVVSTVLLGRSADYYVVRYYSDTATLLLLLESGIIASHDRLESLRMSRMLTIRCCTGSSTTAWRHFMIKTGGENVSSREVEEVLDSPLRPVGALRPVDTDTPSPAAQEA